MTGAAIPVLTTQFDTVIEQLHKLMADVEKGRVSCVLTVAIVNGAVDVRGLGSVDTLAAGEAMARAGLGYFQGLTFRPTKAEIEEASVRLYKQSLADRRDAELWDMTRPPG